MAWQGQRRNQLPTNWQQLRQAVAARAQGRCEWTTAGARCPRPGTDCDHIGNPHDHTLANLRWLCRPHHNEHTAAQAQAAQATRRARLHQPTPPHPGLRNTQVGGAPDAARTPPRSA